MTDREILLAWAESGGFAATHGENASNLEIVNNLLEFLEEHEWELVPWDQIAED